MRSDRREKENRAGSEGVGGFADTIGERLKRAADSIQRQAGTVPKLGIVLGSGFQSLAGAVKAAGELDYPAIPGFRKTRVPGHAGRLLWGSLEGLEVVVCCGRTHYYEGHSMEEVTWPVRVLTECGVRELILTNAAGGINRRMQPGDFMAVTDHINFTGMNPLRGWEPADTRRFVDLSEAYSERLNKEFGRAAKRANVRLYSGVYLGVSGPSYETPAEIRAFRRLGADAVGMSTIPETIAAKYCGLEVGAISCITNFAAGLARQTLSHEEVLETAAASADKACALFRAFAAGRRDANGAQ